MDTDRMDLRSGTLKVLGAVAVMVGLVGAGVTGCELTTPSNFQQDTSKTSDSGNQQTNVSPADLDEGMDDLPVVLAEEAPPT